MRIPGNLEFPAAGISAKAGTSGTHQIHIFEAENEREIRRHLAVRNYLRTHPDDAEDYGRLKKELAGRYPWDIDGYCDGKDAFVKELEKKALFWMQKNMGTSGGYEP